MKYSNRSISGSGDEDVSGSAPAGVAIVRAFPFAFDTPDILTGAALYTPTVGDILLDAWIEIDTAWDGTTPLGDFGQFVSSVQGVFSADGLGPIDMTQADSAANPNPGGILIATQNISVYSASLALANIGTTAQVSGGGPGLAVIFPSTNTGVRGVPAKFLTADPIKFVVSQDGTNTGADPGSTVGDAILYLITATPA